MIMDDVSTMVSIKIAHGDLKFCSTHMMFQMMVKFDNIYILTLHTLWHYGVLRDMSKKEAETSCAEVASNNYIIKVDTSDQLTHGTTNYVKAWVT